MKSYYSRSAELRKRRPYQNVEMHKAQLATL